MMDKIIFLLTALLLSGCVIQFSTSVSMAGSGDTWYLYIEEPSTNFEFSKHGLFWGNVPNRYRISIPKQEGEFEAKTVAINKWISDKDYSEEVRVTNGIVRVLNCVATIELANGKEKLSFNGIYELPSITCKRT